MTGNLRYKILSAICIIFAVLIPGCTSSIKTKWSDKLRVYIAGPVSSPFELQALEDISKEQDSSGYNPYIIFSSGPAALLEELENDKNESKNIITLRNRFMRPVFCYELFKLLEESDCFIFNMNGRVPDLNGLFLTAAAFSAGIPLVIYKNDHRSAFHGNNNSMIDGCTWNFSTVSSIKDLNYALETAISENKKSGIKKMQYINYVKNSVEAGRQIAEYMNSLKQNIKNEQPLEILTSMESITNKIFSSENNTKSLQQTSMNNQKVYCSGGLFSPEEIAEMKSISTVLENSGFKTYLPQRDGIEAFVMNNTNGCIANSFFTRPFLLSINKMVFELDVYEIIDQCNYFVFNMNGTAPDEGGVVETAIAMMHGKPVYIYKSSSDGSWYPFISGANENFAVIDSIEDIPAEIKKTSNPKHEETKIQSNVSEVIQRGRSAKQWSERLNWAKPDNEMDSNTQK